MPRQPKKPWNADLVMPGLLDEPATVVKPSPDSVTVGYSTSVHEPLSEFINASRFRCRSCDISMAVETSASPAAREAFERFCELHGPHEAERLAEKERRMRVPANSSQLAPKSSDKS